MRGRLNHCRYMDSLIASIRHDVEQQCNQSRLHRFLHQTTIDTTLKKHIRALDDAWHAFDVSTIIPSTAP